MGKAGRRGAEILIDPELLGSDHGISDTVLGTVMDARICCNIIIQYPVHTTAIEEK